MPLAECRIRALLYLNQHPRGDYANAIGYAIWPGTSFKSQGAGAAAARILAGLRKDGLVSYARAGYAITGAGIDWLRKEGKP